jgi:hypothetical protein
MGGTGTLNSIAHSGGTRQFSVSEIMQVPGLDIYEQMVCIVLSTFIQEASASIPDMKEIANLGRMSSRETTQALQNLVERGILPHKVFREIVGDFRDSRLSWAAKGLLVFMEKHPKIDLDELLELSGDDKMTILQGLRDLKDFGYLEEECKRLLASAS